MECSLINSKNSNCSWLRYVSRSPHVNAKSHYTYEFICIADVLKFHVKTLIAKFTILLSVNVWIYLIISGSNHRNHKLYLDADHTTSTYPLRIVTLGNKYWKHTWCKGLDIKVTGKVAWVTFCNILWLPWRINTDKRIKVQGFYIRMNSQWLSGTLDLPWILGPYP